MMPSNHSRLRFLVLVFVITLLWFLGRYLEIDAQAIKDNLGKIPLFYSALVFVVLYVAISFFVWFTKDVFWVLSAVLFGPYLSTLFVWIAEVINAVILFSLARLLGRHFVENSLKGKYKELDKKLAHTNLFWLFILRAAPLIPYRFMDLAAGLTNLSSGRYFLVVLLASPIKIFWIQYILSSVGMSVLNRPDALFDYFIANKTITLVSLFYFVLVLVVIYKARKKE